MDEIELYLNFCDEKEIISILKFFKYDALKGDFEEKKLKVRSILKDKSKESIMDISPFVHILFRHKRDEWGNLTEKEFFVTINNISYNIPDYVKFANILLKFPKEKDKYVKLINSNLKDNRSAFDFNINFENEKEIIDFESKLLNNHEEMLNILKDYFLEAVKFNLIHIDVNNIAEVKNWDITTLYKNLKGNDAEGNIYKKFEYLRTHKDIHKELFIKFYTDILNFMMMELFKGK